MKVLLLGATGRTGKLVLEEIVLAKHTAHCIVRKIPAQQFQGITFFKGSPDDAGVLQQAIQGCDAIISVLNISRTSDFPWAGLRTSKTFLSDVMQQLIQLAGKNKVERIIVCSAWGVSETRNHIPIWFRWLIDHSNIRVAYQDHERQEKLLQQSRLQWTIVRPAGLINSKKSQVILESYGNNPKPRLTISRLSVAKFMVSALSDNNLIGKAPVISGA